jgi:hypothetical protein
MLEVETSSIRSFMILAHVERHVVGLILVAKIKVPGSDHDVVIL